MSAEKEMLDFRRQVEKNGAAVMKVVEDIRVFCELVKCGGFRQVSETNR